MVLFFGFITWLYAFWIWPSACSPTAPAWARSTSPAVPFAFSSYLLGTLHRYRSTSAGSLGRSWCSPGSVWFRILSPPLHSANSAWSPSFSHSCCPRLDSLRLFLFLSLGFALTFGFSSFCFSSSSSFSGFQGAMTPSFPSSSHPPRFPHRHSWNRFAEWTNADWLSRNQGFSFCHASQ